MEQKYDFYRAKRIIFCERDQKKRIFLSMNSISPPMMISGAIFAFIHYECIKNEYLCNITCCFNEKK
ncbi:hypothetical protein HMPREF0758_3290 [Serratia odorifera DSM 4582]|uniref:Uncharacterized protein n=1 Tax=Serratia odorifera DSM 4582 TaxID=667129 RepID=D4E540_SEROD|nr:hypothetical protein HMPREF0758_3290 [Serratia odorifera DSM 4582]